LTPKDEPDVDIATGEQVEQILIGFADYPKIV
jgi:hypothetical protein